MLHVKYDISESELDVIIYILTLNNSQYKTLTKDILKSIFDLSVNKESIKNIKNIVFLENIIKNSTFMNIVDDNIKIDNNNNKNNNININIKNPKDKEVNSKSKTDKYHYLRNNILIKKNENEMIIKNISKQLENISKYRNKNNQNNETEILSNWNNVNETENDRYPFNCSILEINRNKNINNPIYNKEASINTKPEDIKRPCEKLLNKYSSSLYNRHWLLPSDNLPNQETSLPPLIYNKPPIYERYPRSKYDIHPMDNRRQSPYDYGRQPPPEYCVPQSQSDINSSVNTPPNTLFEVTPNTMLSLYDRLKLYKSTPFIHDKYSENDGSYIQETRRNIKCDNIKCEGTDNGSNQEKTKNVNKGYNNQEYDYFKNLPDNKKLFFQNIEDEIKEYNKADIPIRFKILEKELTLPNKALVIKKLEDISKSHFLSSNDNKYTGWINGLLKIPFGNYLKLPITKENNKEEINNYLNNTRSLLDDAVHGHEDTKIQIVQLIAQWISNPESGGNVIGIQGPMGTGKTTLVKNGISKAIERPFHFITLGGCSDSSFLEGHSYTYEGSVWGKIVDVLMKAECMNPVFYFDELDKVSKTPKGDEIINALIHLTDNTQNTNFQDQYFTGLDIDLSKSVFIFSYNNINDINPILLDRLINIKIDGFKMEDKLAISRSYLITEICTKLGLDKDTIIMEDDDIQYIIDNYTDEQGVRALKKCLDSIYSKINVFLLTSNKEILPFDIGDIELPYKINKEIIDILLKVNTDKENTSLQYMYM